LASLQLSASIKNCGKTIIIPNHNIHTIHNITSLLSNNENSIMFKLTVLLLLLVYSCNKIRCAKITPITNKGTKKCSENIRLKVALQIVNLAHTLSKIKSPLGKTLNKLVITVAPHNDIFPHGKTYLKNAALITSTNNKLLLFHKFPLT
jgi:hypothetical protein